MSTADRERLRQIRSFPSLVKYLREDLDWPIESDDFDDLTFDYAPEELGIDAKTAAKIQEIKQLRKLTTAQQWGIFFVKFEPRRLPVVALRRILSRLVFKKRQSANAAERASWDKHDLLFISSFGEGEDRQISFAHFTDNDAHGDLPTLKVLGWDHQDTALKLDDIHETLHDKLRWPDDEDDAEAWRSQWSSAFQLRPREVITTSKALAVRLADLARDIRAQVNAALAIETDKGPLKKLMTAFREALIHDLEPDDFADMYAQTIAYGLLSTAVSRYAGDDVQNNLSAADMVALIPDTNPFLKEMFETLLELGGRRGDLDFDELGIQEVVDTLNQARMDHILRDFGNRNPDEDPVIHFYELFLKEYDAKKRMQRGVFYTPKPVVSYIVRSVHELLQTEFGLGDGLADTTTWGQMQEREENRAQCATMLRRMIHYDRRRGVPESKLPEPPHPSEEAHFHLPKIEVVNPKTNKRESKPIDPETPFVQILDPAIGTATFLVEVIDVIYNTMRAKWEAEGHGVLWIDKKWNEYVPKHLLPRLHGYELMMAPYAIAHMKIGLKLFETGYTFGADERARIYLTNALEPPRQFEASFTVPALAHEAEAVNRIKRRQPITVVIGNPPYSGISSNMTPWIDGLLKGTMPDGSSTASYYHVDGQPLGERKLWLQDDYVKFIRWSQHRLTNTGVGIHGYISNHGYLDNPTFRGMRWSLMDAFDDIRVLDLHGNLKKKEVAPDGQTDKPVFEIQQGVGIGLFVRRPEHDAGIDGVSVWHADLWGERDKKYHWLIDHSMGTTDWHHIPATEPFYLFEPFDQSEVGDYNDWPAINDLMPINVTGIVTARDDFVIDFDRSALRQRIADLRDDSLSDQAIRQKYFAGKGAKKYPPGDSRGWKLPKARQKLRDDKQWDKRYAPILYRPFDIREIYYVPWMVDWPRTEAMPHMLAEENLAIISCRQQARAHESWNQVGVTSTIAEACCISNVGKEINYLFPLYLYPGVGKSDASMFNTWPEGKDGRRPNLDPNFIEATVQATGLTFHPDGRGDLKLSGGFGPEDVLAYIYAVFHCPEYRRRFGPMLKLDFPRVPPPGAAKPFAALATLGHDLLALHLLESPRLDKPIARFKGPESPEVGRVAWSDDTVWLDAGKADAKAGQIATKPGTVGFEGVPEQVWRFHIGGFQVCHKWLKDRKGRKLTDEDITHYQKIVTAIHHTIRLMQQIDETIDAHGGWPDAFITDPDKIEKLKNEGHRPKA